MAKWNRNITLKTLGMRLPLVRKCRKSSGSAGENAYTRPTDSGTSGHVNVRKGQIDHVECPFRFRDFGLELP
eukprot:CAMPEP_0170631866 /NCGR_PEP_ID=MMETSP0224-20130122/34926_1 /TAXON_ID=285029 /ORGANISM="Togula jolla, Strain CCCM 725" /LENGTH=71 /DNA_ID=CAMNT_0010960347 /DNA_START=32 /DNA_END=244 /DNA_ORIENTATION=-